MAYELDYRKVHNTLGKPRQDNFGENIGQYVTNLLPQQDADIIELQSLHVVPQGDLDDFIAEYQAEANSYCSGLVPVMGLTLYNIKSFVTSRDTWFSLIGQSGEEYYAFDFFDNHNYSAVSSVDHTAAILTPNTGDFEYGGTTYTISQWYIAIIQTGNRTTIPFLFKSSSTLPIIDQKGLVIDSKYDFSGVINLSAYSPPALTKEEVQNLLLNNPPIVNIQSNSVTISLPSIIYSSDKLKQWMKNTNTCIALSIIKKHENPQRSYKRGGLSFNTSKKYTVIRCIDSKEENSKAILLHGHYWVREQLNSSITFTLNSSDNKNTILSLIAPVPPSDVSCNKYATSEDTNTNDLRLCALCKGDIVHNSQVCNQIVFALSVVPAQGRNYNGSRYFFDAPQEDSYYSNNIVYIPTVS